jgi:hypothetical protein
MEKTEETDEDLREKRKEKAQIRKIVSKAEAVGKFELFELEEIKSYMKRNPRFYLAMPFCESCGAITKELFEEPITSRRIVSKTLCCKECKSPNYAEIDKGAIIDEVQRRETQKIKYNAENIAMAKGMFG